MLLRCPDIRFQPSEQKLYIFYILLNNISGVKPLTFIKFSVNNIFIMQTHFCTGSVILYCEKNAVMKSFKLCAEHMNML